MFFYENFMEQKGCHIDFFVVAVYFVVSGWIKVVSTTTLNAATDYKVVYATAFPYQWPVFILGPGVDLALSLTLLPNDAL